MKTHLTAAALFTLAAGASTALAQYRAELLPVTGLNQGFITSASGTKGVGYGGGPITGGNSHPLIWDALTNQIIDLNPSGNVGSDPLAISSGGFLYGAGGNQQVGLIIAGLRDVATLWTGTAASAVYLDQPFMDDSVANGTDGVNQVGSASFPDAGFDRLQRAFAWSGTAASAVNIHPPQFFESFASKVSQGKAVGGYVDDVGFFGAILWTTLTPGGALDLRPANYLEAVATDIRGDVVIGQGQPDGSPWHATIWTQNGTIITDIHPPGYFASFLYSMNATRQVGVAATLPDPDTGENEERAIVWAGTASSAFDLHTALVAVLPGATDSTALAITEDGVIYGNALVGNTNGIPVRWIPLCGFSDVAGPGQAIGGDSQLTADDIIVFLNWFFASDARANVAGAGQSTTALDNELTADDIIVFLNRFFAGC